MFRLLRDAFHGMLQYFHIRLPIAVFNYSCILRGVCVHIIALVKRRVLLEENKTRRAERIRVTLNVYFNIGRCDPLLFALDGRLIFPGVERAS